MIFRDITYEEYQDEENFTTLEMILSLLSVQMMMIKPEGHYSINPAKYILAALTVPIALILGVVIGLFVNYKLWNFKRKHPEYFL